MAFAQTKRVGVRVETRQLMGMDLPRSPNITVMFILGLTSSESALAVMVWCLVRIWEQASGLNRDGR